MSIDFARLNQEFERLQGKPSIKEKVVVKCESSQTKEEERVVQGNAFELNGKPAPSLPFKDKVVRNFLEVWISESKKEYARIRGVSVKELTPKATSRIYEACAGKQRLFADKSKDKVLRLDTKEALSLVSVGNSASEVDKAVTNVFKRICSGYQIFQGSFNYSPQMGKSSVPRSDVFYRNGMSA